MHYFYFATIYVRSTSIDILKSDSVYEVKLESVGHIPECNSPLYFI